MDEKESIVAEITGQAPAPQEKPDPLAAEKAAFAALLKASKEDKDDGAALTEAKKAASATKAPKTKKPEAPKEAAPAEAKAPEPAKASDPEAERLRAKLRLAGAPPSALKNLSDDDVREWWRVQEERERVQASALERASAAEKKLEALGKTTSASEPKGVPTDELDLDEVAHELADQFGQDESGTILKALKVLTEPLLKRVGELEGVINQARERGVKDISEKNRSRLAEKLPSLSTNDRAWKLIHAEVEKAFKEDPAKFSSVEAAFDDAFESIYGPLLAEQSAAKAAADEVADYAEEKAQIAASAPTPPAPTKPRKKLTPIDGAWEAFRVLQKDAEDVDGARKAFGRALVQ